MLWVMFFLIIAGTTVGYFLGSANGYFEGFDDGYKSATCLHTAMKEQRDRDLS